MDIESREEVGRKKGDGAFSYLTQIRKTEMHASQENKPNLNGVVGRI